MNAVLKWAWTKSDYWRDKEITASNFPTVRAQYEQYYKKFSAGGKPHNIESERLYGNREAFEIED